jgi:DNA-binding NarL/FixJ family response regulator
MSDARGPMKKIRILCVDDHAVVRDGIGAILNLQPDMSLVASALNWPRGTGAVSAHPARYHAHGSPPGRYERF